MLNLARIFMLVLISLLINPSCLKAQTLITIPKGSSSKQISKILLQNKIIENALNYRIYLKAYRLETKLQAGSFVFENRKYNFSEITDILTSKNMANQFKKVLIQEGLTLGEIAEKLEAVKIIPSATAYLNYLKNKARSDLKQEFSYLNALPKDNFEGYLFPETYHFRIGSTFKEITRAFLKQFDEKIYQYWIRFKGPKPYSFHQTLSLAAIVEKEAMVESELPIIASVYHNRLIKGMKLEADPTVAYALGQPRKKRIYYKDLKTPSPYNTYYSKGIPPGPIAAVGEKAFKATLSPKKTPYLFFVAHGDGSHNFSKTYAEHLVYQKKYHTLIKNKKQF